MSVRSTVLQLIDGEKPWTWSEFAQGYLAGTKVRRIVGTELNSFNLAYITCSSYKWIHFAGKVGLPNKLKWGLVIALGVKVGFCIEGIRRDATDRVSIFWQALCGMNAVGTAAEIVYEFHQYPMKTVAFLGSILMRDSLLGILTSQVSAVFTLHQALLIKDGLFRAKDWFNIHATMTKIYDVVTVVFLMYSMPPVNINNTQHTGSDSHGHAHGTVMNMGEKQHDL